MSWFERLLLVGMRARLAERAHACFGGCASFDDDLKEHSSPLGRYASVDEKYHHHLSAEELPCVGGSVGWPGE